MNIFLALFSAATCGIVGALAGALAVIAAVIFTSGDVQAGADRRDLLEIMVEEGIDLETANRVTDKGVEKWSRWRAKMRPLLWRVASEWPEYLQTTKEEFQNYYEQELRQYQPEELLSPEEADEFLSDSHASLQAGKLAIETPSEPS